MIEKDMERIPFNGYEIKIFIGLDVIFRVFYA